MIRPPPKSTLFPYPPLFRSDLTLEHEPSSTAAMLAEVERLYNDKEEFVFPPWCPHPMCGEVSGWKPWGGTKDLDRKSTRLNSSHANISYAVFCLKKKK